MLDRLVKALGSGLAQDVDHLELRAEDLLKTTISVSESGVDTLLQRRERGHSARVLHDGVWGFAASDGSSGVEEAIASALAVARALSPARGRRALLAPVNSIQRTISSKVTELASETPSEEKIAHLTDLCSKVLSSSPRIKACEAEYSDAAGTRWLATSEGTRVESEVSLIHLKTTAQGKKAGQVCSARDEFGVVDVGWEHLDRRETAEAVANRLSARVLRQLDGAVCRTGTFACVLSPRVAGMLAHEALGHLSEADFFSTGAFAGLGGQQIAPDSITMIDAPRVAHGFGNTVVDDEGVAGRRAVLIDKGYLRDQLTDREWAARLGTRPTGNARAESFRVPPMIRMRNTYFARGDARMDEVLEGIKFGYYLVDIKGGQAESNSSFQVGIQECFEIRSGEIGRPVKYAAISGLALKALKLIDVVGKDFGIESSYCGKSDQAIATSDGGPHVRVGKGAIVVGGVR